MYPTLHQLSEVAINRRLSKTSVEVLEAPDYWSALSRAQQRTVSKQFTDALSKGDDEAALEVIEQLRAASIEWLTRSTPLGDGFVMARSNAKYASGVQISIIDVEAYRDTVNKIKVPKNLHDNSIQLFANRIAYDTVTAGSIKMHKAGDYFTTDEAYVNPKYQGQGLMVKAYVKLIQSGYKLKSDVTHSIGGIKLWKALAKQKGVKVQAYDPKKKTFLDIEDLDSRHAGFSIKGGGFTHADDRDYDKWTKAHSKKMDALYQKMSKSGDDQYWQIQQELDVLKKEYQAASAHNYDVSQIVLVATKG